MHPLFPSPLRHVLCLGAHSDDIEIGCGGTLLRLQAEHPDVRLTWVVFSAEPPRDHEARASARNFLPGRGPHEVRVHDHRTSYFPSEHVALKERFEELKAQFAPDLIFTHHRHDRHQDHRTLWELTWNTFRHHLILEYEIPKYDADLGAPNLFVPLPERLVDHKVEHLLRHFGTQSNKHWFTADLFRGLMRLRGMECGATHAEAFHAPKLVLGPTPTP